jgi:hypothetical protein
MNMISVIIGILALLGALVGFIPLLGWFNWLVIPLAVLGLVLGVVARENTGRNINLVVIVLAAFRLFLGGGLL